MASPTARQTPQRQPGATPEGAPRRPRPDRTAGRLRKGWVSGGEQPDRHRPDEAAGRGPLRG
eukprot:8179341-Alexandrium_andersonii.AAC.1